MFAAKRGKASFVALLSMVFLLVAGSLGTRAEEPVYKVIRDMGAVPVIEGAYEDEALAKGALKAMDLEHDVVGKLRREELRVFFVDQYVDDVARWYEKALGYPNLTIDDLGVMGKVGPGEESPVYYAYEYYNFPDYDGYDQLGNLVWPGAFVTKELALTRRTWMRGAILRTASYGWYFKDTDNSVTDVMVYVTDTGFDFQQMTYTKRTAVVVSWEVYEPYVDEALPTEEYDPELALWMKDVEDFAQMLMDDPPTPEMLDVPIHKDMLFDPFTTAMYMMEGDPMYTFYWDVEPTEAVRMYSEELMLKPLEYEGGWVFLFAGRLPYPMHALYVYPNEFEGVPFKTVVFVRKEIVTK